MLLDAGDLDRRRLLLMALQTGELKKSEANDLLRLVERLESVSGVPAADRAPRTGRAPYACAVRRPNKPLTPPAIRPGRRNPNLRPERTRPAINRSASPPMSPITLAVGNRLHGRTSPHRRPERRACPADRILARVGMPTTRSTSDGATPLLARLMTIARRSRMPSSSATSRNWTAARMQGTSGVTGTMILFGQREEGLVERSVVRVHVQNHEVVGLTSPG